MATYVNDLRLKEISTGDESGTWGTSTNTNLELIAEAFGRGSEALSDTSTQNITMTDGTSDAVRSMSLTLTGSLSQASTVTLLPNTVSKVWIIENSTSGGQSVTLSQGSGANVTIANGEVKVIATDGAGSGAAVYDLFTDLSVAGNFKVSGDLTVSGDDITLGTNTSGHLLVADGTNYNPVALSGDATLASSGALTIANDAVEQAMVADNAIGADQLAANAVTQAKLADDAVGAAELAANAVVNASIASGAAIDATKIANGTVSNTEFQYINTLSSNAQTQLTSKLANTVNTNINSSEGQRRFYFTSGSHTYIDSASNTYIQSGSASKFTVASDGTCTATGDIEAYSDITLKENIYQIENALEKVNKLRGVHFTRKATQQKEIGVVANEVEKIVPELVNDHEDTELGTIKTMKYANTVGLLIEAVKELSNQVEDLKNGSTS